MDQRCVRTCAVLCVIVGLISLAACGGGSSGSTPPPPPPKVTLSSIAVTPAGPSVTAGSTQQFKATGTFSDGSTQDLTSSATWTSSITSAATINSTGLATGVAAGQSTISATQTSVTGSTNLTVKAPAAKLLSIKVTPDNTSIVRGTTEQFTATGKFDDGTSHPVTSSVTWKSDNTSAATINSSGVATGVAAESGTPASVNISATSGTITSNSVSLKVVGSAIPQAGWFFRLTDSEAFASNHRAFLAIDGDPNSFWETDTTNPTAPPHEIQVDLGARYNITGFTYLPRQDGITDGTIGQYEFFVSNDGTNWGTAVASGTFASNTSQKEADFAPVAGRFVRLRALSEINGKLETSVAELGVLGTPVGVSSQNNFSLQSVDSEATSATCTTAELATNSFDGNPFTFWQTPEMPNCASTAALPHEIQIDLGNPQVVNGFRYLPRQDGITDGMIKQYEFSVSNDSTNPTNWTVVTPGSPTFPPTIQQKEVPFVDTTGRFVRLRALSEVNNGSSTSAAEINVLQCAVTPSVVITQPATYDVIATIPPQTSSSIIVTAQGCLDPSTEAGWGVRFTLDSGTSMDVHSQPFQVTFTGVTRAEHTLEAQIIDNKGAVVSGTGTHDQITHVGVGDYYVAMGDSITQGFADDVVSDDLAKDGRRSNPPCAQFPQCSSYGGWEPILDDKLTARKGYPQRVVNEGVGGTFASATTCTPQPLPAEAGINLAPVLLMKHPNAQMFLLMYGTNDSACGVSAADYKAAMQQIITLIASAGKKVALSHVPFVLNKQPNGPPDPNPDTLAQNALIQQYNTAIDQLVSANGITVTPPDFYTLFHNNDGIGGNPNHYFDNWHPDGVLIQDMATAWSNALP
jgi:lysophospholipase L1-like esterase